MNGMKQRKTPRWQNKPKPNNLRNLIRHSVKATKRKPEIWQQILQMAVFLAKNMWNISDEITIKRISFAIYNAAREALEPKGKTPEDFLEPVKIDSHEFHPTKIEGDILPAFPTIKDATNEPSVAPSAGQ